MRSGEAFVQEVLDRCRTLQKSGLWPQGQELRPRAWIDNFDEHDRPIAAVLLDRFVFCSTRVTRQLLQAAHESLVDGSSVRPARTPGSSFAPSSSDAYFTPVEGEAPNVTDSGRMICRWARQELGIPSDRAVEPAKALELARSGESIIFVDDFVGSGNQFISTWEYAQPRHATSTSASSSSDQSFAAAYARRPFKVAYLTLVATEAGVRALQSRAPGVVLAAAHVIGSESSVGSIDRHPAYPIDGLPERIDALLDKYSGRLVPQEDYMQTPAARKFGFRNLGLLFGFEHSMPDATLPLFWSPGVGSWTPLRERK